MHIPVLAERFLDAVKNMPKQPTSYLDCTFGRGGHFKLLLENINAEIKADLIDRDKDALDFGEKVYGNQQNINFYHLNFMKLASEAPEDLIAKRFDLILADLGVSSPQLDAAERGFSFYHDGPLDMRMDVSKGISAAEIVNEWSKEDLESLFKELGEVRNPTKVVDVILEQRAVNAFTSTLELAELVVKTHGWRKKGQHPATKYFLALRIAVNEEISLLKEAIIDLLGRLNIGGHLIVITFHSMEDRIVKWTLKENTHLGEIITKKAIQPKWQEKQENPRARSAIMRIFKRGENE